jgi:hypothetical protein
VAGGGVVCEPHFEESALHDVALLDAVVQVRVGVVGAGAGFERVLREGDAVEADPREADGVCAPGSVVRSADLNRLDVEQLRDLADDAGAVSDAYSAVMGRPCGAPGIHEALRSQGEFEATVCVSDLQAWTGLD